MRFILLQNQVDFFNQHIIHSILRHFKIHLFEHKIKVFNLYPVSKISSFPLLLKNPKTSENNFYGKKIGIKGGSNEKAFKSSNEKKKNKVKFLTITPDIQLNDFMVKFKQVQKFLDKGLQVTMKVDNSKNTEGGVDRIFNQIQESVVKQKISAKVTKVGSAINIFPVVTDNQQSQNKTALPNSTSDSKNKS